ncbi:CBS domain containing protein [Pseudopedobacter saltans DSM 12145]|uniref:CBS domain containing protein n=1 Tax=Pseudopedobacter saltans (strain ATCC 51119 / DSM 12145 / JCM 21818 / CCUG 39354 / LMG 10337 / NBRC 100064 / NCIMB 13643) TaxID=762903 RepID=F0S9V4_PSESL|nr:CBS domain-containing protein [Pseudopedobacter saltans]ADY52512.1 CBS domain containing protein [Pseudopedobacter saltans DSM 12145]
MIAEELITNTITPLKVSDSIQKAEYRMAEFHVRHLPIVKKHQFIGLVSEEDIATSADMNATLETLNLSLINPFVYEDQHVYDVIRAFFEQKLSVLPVLSYDMDYLGLISQQALTDTFARMFSVSEMGAIIVLEVGNRDNSMSHIAQIIESNNIQILSSYVEPIPDSTRLEVTLKLNKIEINNVVAAFLRYNYTVKATYNFLDRDNGAKDRYDSLMNYLSFD